MSLAEEMEQMRAWTAIAVAMAMLVLPYNCMATNYTVGGTKQWDTGVDYTTWAAGETFRVGDNLIFTYTSLHNVLEVSKSAYDSCTASNALNSHNGGSTSIALASTGAKYFICGTPGHCSGGMKLGITVAAASTGTTPSSTTSPPPPSTTSNTPSANAAMAAHSYKDVAVLLVGSLVLGALAVRML